MHRTKIIGQYPQIGGKDCPIDEIGHREIGNCNEDPCPGKEVNL